MKEVLLATKDKLYVRKLQRDDDIYNLFPRGKYEEREATPEDVKRISPQLWEELQKNEKTKS